MRIAVSTYTATSAAGIGLTALHESISSRQTGLASNTLENCDLNTWVGRVAALENTTLPSHLSHLHSRNNQLAWLGLQQDGLPAAIEMLAGRVGADRIGVVMGTSTSSIGRTEEAYAGSSSRVSMA